MKPLPCAVDVKIAAVLSESPKEPAESSVGAPFVGPSRSWTGKASVVGTQKFPLVVSTRTAENSALHVQHEMTRPPIAVVVVVVAATLGGGGGGGML